MRVCVFCHDMKIYVPNTEQRQVFEPEVFKYPSNYSSHDPLEVMSADFDPVCVNTSAEIEEISGFIGELAFNSFIYGMI